MNLANFDLNLLKVLDALIETRSTTRAADRIGLSQPAVSSALKRLRAALDDPILVRAGPKMIPTDYALSLAAPLRRVLEQTEVLIAGAPTFDPASAKDIFRISGSDFFSEMLIPPLSDYLATAAPNIRLQHVDLVPDSYPQTLESREVDLALFPRTEGPSWMESAPLFRNGFVLIARRDHPVLKARQAVDLDTFCALSHILFSPEGNLRIMGDIALEKIGRARRVAMTLPVMYGVCSAVAETDHVARVSYPLAHKLQGKLPIGIFPPPAELALPEPELVMAWHRRFTAAPAHRWLRDCVARLMAPLDKSVLPPPR